MLDDRLLGMTFTLSSDAVQGSVTIFGINYHYELIRPAVAGTNVRIERVTPLSLYVLPVTEILDY
ncbi:hypothetical protein [Lacticaseibacillus zhaodongensis]|uniref:hypothetical protein n=1 Tax=Lacticaseibacillus zhaodongensis TaxID=2668065 RepID=UPI0012D2C7E0|nr:hypothetical protein [Lacticaseibacillus zhaodongensis]